MAEAAASRPLASSSHASSSHASLVGKGEDGPVRSVRLWPEAVRDAAEHAAALHISSAMPVVA